MEVQPAHISQVLATDGRFVEISSDVCSVAADLKQIDPRLAVWFRPSPAGPYFSVVLYEKEGEAPRTVLTQKAHEGSTGQWQGLDQRIVKRIMEVGHSSYDFAKEQDAQIAERKAEREHKKRETLGAAAEHLAWAARKDLGVTSKIVVPRDVQ